mmetsp:Transcript_4994/g.11020  ORF Transcript_4994/g.11020 Transcript_4994/m.11020 type:complete len:269 (-) Transcript_4994:1510-2316(-)
MQTQEIDLAGHMVQHSTLHLHTALHRFADYGRVEEKLLNGIEDVELHRQSHHLHTGTSASAHIARADLLQGPHGTDANLIENGPHGERRHLRTLHLIKSLLHHRVIAVAENDEHWGRIACHSVLQGVEERTTWHTDDVAQAPLGHQLTWRSVEEQLRLGLHFSARDDDGLRTLCHPAWLESAPGACYEVGIAGSKLLNYALRLARHWRDGVSVRRNLPLMQWHLSPNDLLLIRVGAQPLNPASEDIKLRAVDLQVVVLHSVCKDLAVP